MLERARLAVVVPAHNEDDVDRRDRAAMPGYVDHVIVVDDASLDATAREARTPETRASR